MANRTPLTERDKDHLRTDIQDIRSFYHQILHQRTGINTETVLDIMRSLNQILHIIDHFIDANTQIDWKKVIDVRTPLTETEREDMKIDIEELMAFCKKILYSRNGLSKESFKTIFQILKRILYLLDHFIDAQTKSPRQV